MVTLIKQIFSFSEAVEMASLWDCFLMFFLGALLLLELFIVCAILGTLLYSLGELIKNKKLFK